MPKPFGYIYLDLPEHKYERVTTNELHYTVDISRYAVLNRPEDYDSGWIDIVYSDLDANFQATIQMTYIPVNNDKNKLRLLLDDAHKLVYKHHVRATSIEQEVIENSNGVQFVFVTISGEVPTSFQFYTLNSKDHFLRGALYFPTALANDYLAPIIEYIKIDIRHMLSTIQWKNTIS